MTAKGLMIAASCLLALAGCGDASLEKAPEAPKAEPRELYPNPPISSSDIDAIVAETKNETQAKNKK